MAGIDKTYTDSYKEYVDFKEWVSSKEIIYNTNQKVRLINYIYDWIEEDFTSELPIMNTPTSVDIFLIQNCPMEFIQNRMKEVYGKTYDELKTLEFPVKIPSDYKQNRKINIKKDGKFYLYNKGMNNHRNWWLQSSSHSFWFDDDNNIWVNKDLYLPCNTNTSHHQTIKSLIRFLRKQKLPKGIEFRLTGRYIGEEFKIIIK